MARELIDLLIAEDVHQSAIGTAATLLASAAIQDALSTSTEPATAPADPSASAKQAE